MTNDLDTTDMEFIEAFFSSHRSRIFAASHGVLLQLDGEKFAEVEYPRSTSTARKRGRRIRRNGEAGRSWRHE